MTYHLLRATHHRFYLACILLACTCLLRCVRAEWQPLELFRQQFIGPNFFVAFIPPTSNQWVRVEYSEDLETWTERANVLTTRQSHLFAEPDAVALPRRFYRLSVPGRTVSEARARWDSMEISEYRFEFLILPQQGSPLIGTITVTGGQKTVSNVSDAVTNEPLSDFTPDDFPNIEELFEIIAETVAPAKSVDCEVSYDPQWGFPSTSRYTTGHPGWTTYEISNFEILPPNADRTD